MPNQNEELQLTLDDCVAEVLGLLTGLELTYVPEQSRYYAIARQLNRAMRSVALEREWSWYSDVRSIGESSVGDQLFTLPASIRPRIIGDDSVRLVRLEDNHPVKWAYFLPRDALHKYADRNGLWCAVTGNDLMFSRPLVEGEDGLDIQVPVMREPVMFRLPLQPEDPEDPLITVPDDVRLQLIDFPYPDLICQRAAMYYAQTDPVMQPRVQYLDAQQKDLMYQIIEREERFTDSPYLNEFQVPVMSDLSGSGYSPHPHHPHADERI